MWKEFCHVCLKKGLKRAILSLVYRDIYIYIYFLLPQYFGSVIAFPYSSVLWLSFVCLTKAMSLRQSCLVLLRQSHEFCLR